MIYIYQEQKSSTLRKKIFISKPSQSFFLIIHLPISDTVHICLVLGTIYFCWNYKLYIFLHSSACHCPHLLFFSSACPHPYYLYSSACHCLHFHVLYFCLLRSPLAAQLGLQLHYFMSLVSACCCPHCLHR